MPFSRRSLRNNAFNKTKIKTIIEIVIPLAIVTFFPVVDCCEKILKDPNIAEKVKKSLKDLGADEASTLPYLLEKTFYLLLY